MKPVRIFFMFFYTWRCTTFNSIPNISILLTNKNVPLIYSITFCQQKTKDCVPSASKLQFSFLFFLCLPPFITLSPLHNFSFEIKIGDVKSVRQKRTWIREWLFKDSCSVCIQCLSLLVILLYFHNIARQARKVLNFGSYNQDVDRQQALKMFWEIFLLT